MNYPPEALKMFAEWIFYDALNDPELTPEQKGWFGFFEKCQDILDDILNDMNNLRVYSPNRYELGALRQVGDPALIFAGCIMQADMLTGLISHLIETGILESPEPAMVLAIIRCKAVHQRILNTIDYYEGINGMWKFLNNIHDRGYALLREWIDHAA